MLFFLMAVLGFNSAQADQLSDFGYIPADALMKSGYSSKKENGLTTLKKEAGGGMSYTFLSQENENNKYVAHIASLDKNSYARYVQVSANGKASAFTRCERNEAPTGKTFTCRTQTVKYCKELNQISRGLFSGDMRILKECASILERIKFDAKGVETANATAMGVLEKQLGISMAQVDNRINPPISLRDLLEDYAACRDPHMPWDWQAHTSTAGAPPVPKGGKR